MILVALIRTRVIVFPLFLLSGYIINRFIKEQALFYISFIPLEIIFFITLFQTGTNIGSTIIYLVFIPITFYLGFNYKKGSFIYHLLYFLFLIFIGRYGFLNLDAVTKNIHSRKINISPKIVLKTSEDKTIQLDTIKNKVIVLDFWTTSCGVCFRKFPDFDNIYSKYKNNPKIELYAVNIPIKRDTLGQAKKMISYYKYNFPVLYAKSDSIPLSLNFNGYPHLIIIKNREIRYNGTLVTSSDIIFNNLEDEIELLLSEDK